MTSASSIVAGVAGGRQARSVADHTPFDIWVYEEHQRAVRPWLTVILDDYSRAVASFGLRLQTPSSQQTALALREASGARATRARVGGLTRQSIRAPWWCQELPLSKSQYRYSQEALTVPAGTRGQSGSRAFHGRSSQLPPGAASQGRWPQLYMGTDEGRRCSSTKCGLHSPTKHNLHSATASRDSREIRHSWQSTISPVGRLG
jgi:hypothetical protein